MTHHLPTGPRPGTEFSGRVTLAQIKALAIATSTATGREIQFSEHANALTVEFVNDVCASDDLVVRRPVWNIRRPGWAPQQQVSGYSQRFPHEQKP